MTPAQAQALADSIYTVTADISDKAGNPATEATQIITVTESVDDWTGAAGNGNWATAGNWDNGVPTSAMTAKLNLGGTFTVTSSSSVTVNGLISTPTQH